MAIVRKFKPDQTLNDVMTAMYRPEIQPRARARIVVSNPTPNPTREPVQAPPPAANDAAVAKPDYEIGYKKPPKKNQFKKGQSGNPRGRPKGAKGMKTLTRKLLTEKVVVKTAYGSKKMTRIEAMLHKIAERAFAGDMRALQSLIQLYQLAVPDEPLRIPMAEAVETDLDAHDAAILDALRASLKEQGDGS